MWAQFMDALQVFGGLAEQAQRLYIFVPQKAESSSLSLSLSLSRSLSHSLSLALSLFLNLFEQFVSLEEL